MRVAIVHDWLISGGAERVVHELHRMYPNAPIYASYCNDEWRKKLDDKVVTGFLQHKPFPKLRKYIPFLRIWWFTHLDFSDYDLVISSSGSEAKGLKVPKNVVHINYCHAPTHYYWSRYDDYIKHPGFGLLDPLARLGLRLLVGPLRRWDFAAAQRPDVLIANSSHTAAAIKRYYKRKSTVIFPPVELERFKQKNQNHRRQGYVIAGRQTAYKRIDLAVQACTKLNLPLKVIGKGPDHDRLVDIAGPSITFLSNVPDKDMAKHFAEAKAFLFPGTDDFGIVAVEALAAGTPVIAYKDGGALDYVKHGVTGLFFEQQTVDGLVGALKEAEYTNFDNKAVEKSAENFSTKRFIRNMDNIIAKHTT